MFSFAFAIMFRSIIGLALVPVWWVGLLLHTLVEEESLERALGERYVEHKKRVLGRIIPGLPIQRSAQPGGLNGRGR